MVKVQFCNIAEEYERNKKIITQEDIDYICYLINKEKNKIEERIEYLKTNENVTEKHRKLIVPILKEELKKIKNLIKKINAVEEKKK